MSPGRRMRTIAARVGPTVCSRRTAAGPGVLALYVLISIAFFGRDLWPHPGRPLIGLADQQDPEIFVWAFAWWPHAIGAWTNPFVTHAIYQPVGANLTWTTSVPGLALAFAPLTELAGPTASFNVAALLLPALSAWTAYLLCRVLTRSTWASLIGGYLYGFSSYMIAHEYAGHLQLTAVFLIPVAALLLLRYHRGDLRGRGLVWRFGVLFGFQLLISTEVAFTLTLMLLLTIALALVLAPSARPRILSGLAPLAAGYALAAVLASPFLVFLILGFEHGSFVTPAFYDADLLNLVVPTRLMALGGTALSAFTSHFPGNDNERDTYLGAPVLLIAGLHAVRTWRSAATRIAVGVLAVASVIAIGTSLHLDGHRVVAFPWALVVSLPVFSNVITPRFAVYAALAATVLVASWIASRPGRFTARPVLLPLLAIAALVPAVWSVAFARTPERWPFFTQGIYKICIPRGETLAIFPFGRWGDSMLWQAESGFAFRMAEGDLGRDTFPPAFVADPTVAELQFQFTDPNVRPTVQQLLQFVKSHHVDRVVSVVIHAYPDGTQMHAFGPLQEIGGVLVAPACGYTSLAGDTRRLPND